MKKMLLFLIVTFARKKIKSGDAVSGRNFILGNEDLLIGVVTPTEKWTISTVTVMAMKCCLSITEQEN